MRRKKIDIHDSESVAESKKNHVRSQLPRRPNANMPALNLVTQVASPTLRRKASICFPLVGPLSTPHRQIPLFLFEYVRIRCKSRILRVGTRYPSCLITRIPLRNREITGRLHSVISRRRGVHISVSIGFISRDGIAHLQ